jgi:CHASE2 domain-containing sensor protein
LKSSLRETETALAETKRRRGQVEQAGVLAPQNTAGFAKRVDELDGRVLRLQPRLEAAAAGQERVLAVVAVRELEAQKKRLASYATQAQFALAALYDGAALGAAATADANGDAR